MLFDTRYVVKNYEIQLVKAIVERLLKKPCAPPLLEKFLLHH